MDSAGGGDGSPSGIRVVLSEADVPCASLNGRNPADLTIPQLKCWLQCHDAPMKGKEANLVARQV